MRRPSLLSALCAVCIALAVPGTAKAQTFFSNFGPGNTYNTGSGWGINAPQAVAASFTPEVSGTADRIDLAFRHVRGTNNYRLSFFADAGGVPAMVPQMSVILNEVAPQTPVPFTVTLSSPLSLTAGTRYWVGLFNNDPTADGAWHWNSIGQTGFMFTGTPQTPNWLNFNAATPTFRVYASAPMSAPEPSSIALLALAGAMGFWLVNRKRN